MSKKSEGTTPSTDKNLIEIIEEFSKTYLIATNDNATIRLTTSEVCEKIRDFYPGEFLNNEIYNVLRDKGYNFKPIGDTDIIFYWLFKK